MFRLIEPSSGQIQNIVLVHSVGAHYGIPYCLQNYIDIKRSCFSINRCIENKYVKTMCLKHIYIYKDFYQYVFVKYARLPVYY